MGTRVKIVTPEGASAGEEPQADGEGGYSWGAGSGSGIAIGDTVSGGTDGQLLGIDGSGNLTDPLATSSVVTGSGTPTFGQVPVYTGTGQETAPGSAGGGSTFESITLDGTNGDLTAPSGPTTFVFTQDATGGRIVSGTWWESILWAGGTAPTLSTAANAIDVITVHQVGSNWLGFVVGLDMAAPPPPSSLLTNLKEAWLFNETSGNRVGAVNGILLAPWESGSANATAVTRVAGPGDITYAASFTAADSEFLTAAYNSELSITTSTDGWWVWCWFKLASNPAANDRFGLISKRDDSFGNEYELNVYYNSGSVYQVDIWGSVTETAITFTPDTNWHLAEAWYDNVAQTINVAIDGGSPASNAQTTPGAPNNSAFFVGASYQSIGYMDGEIATPYVRAMAPQSGERAAVWNSGAGVQYPF